MKLAGKVALVTGAAAAKGGKIGIGRASAVALAQQGADVAINDLPANERAAEELAGQIRALGRKAMVCLADVSDQDQVERMVGRVAAELGRLDVFVSVAVYSTREPFHTADMAGFRKTIDVSMWGAFYGLRASANQMIKQGGGGCAVIVSSPHAVLAFPSCMAYNMAKAGLDQMARTAAVELFPHRIRVNIVYPGWTDTPSERNFFSEDVLAKSAKELPWGRLARPEEIARGVVFLADPDSDYVTGTTLAIDGGTQLPYWSERGTGEF